MKILQLGKFYPPVFGGIENVIYEQTTGLNDRGILCDVLCSHDKYEYVEDKIDSYTIFRTKTFGKYFSTSFTPQMIIKLKEIQDNYDVIVVHFPDPMAALSLFLARPKAKIVIYWHSDIIKQKILLKLYEPLQDWVIKRAELVIGATKNHIIGSDKYELFKNKYKIISYPFNSDNLMNTVDEFLLASLKKKYYGKKVIFGMGRLVYYKGFEYLIDSAKYFDDDYIILIGGNGELKEKLEKQIRDHELSDKVQLLGSIPHEKLGTYYLFCDIFCLPSIHRSEMFGIVQLEAMSFGKPVISTKIKKSGICDVNIDEITGKCVQPMNSEELALAIKFIFEDEVRYNFFATNCINRVKTVYAKKIILEELINCYNQL